MLRVLGVQKCTWSHTLSSHGGFCVVSDCALLGCYCCLQNRAMQVPGPTHLMKIKWNFSSLCWNIRMEKFSQAREGGAPGLPSDVLHAAGKHWTLLQLAVVPFHTSINQPRLSYCFDLAHSFLRMFSRLHMTLIKEKRDGNPWLLYLCRLLKQDNLEQCFPNNHKLIPLSVMHLLFLSSYTVSKCISY